MFTVLKNFSQIQSTSKYRTSPVFEWSICVRLSNGLVIEWLKQYGNHSKTGQILSGFRMVPTSLDHFINKTVIKRIFLIFKQSRLVVKKGLVRFLNVRPFCYHSKTEPRKWSFENQIVRFLDVHCTLFFIPKKLSINYEF